MVVIVCLAEPDTNVASEVCLLARRENARPRFSTSFTAQSGLARLGKFLAVQNFSLVLDLEAFLSSVRRHDINLFPKVACTSTFYRGVTQRQSCHRAKILHINHQPHPTLPRAVALAACWRLNIFFFTKTRFDLTCARSQRMERLISR